MSTNDNQRVRFVSTPSIHLFESKSISSSNASRRTSEQILLLQESLSGSSLRTRSSVSHVPPDSLMYPLFDAIQRKLWSKARHLCRQLMSFDPEQILYYELYIRLEQIVILNDKLRYQ